MSTPNTHRGRVSRETRQLLGAALVALISLWVLSRIRFQDQPTTPNPIPSLLSQISAAPRFANLAGEIAELQNRVSEAWLAIVVTGAEDTVETSARRQPALKIRDNIAVMWLRNGDRLVDPEDVVVADRVTGLSIVRKEGAGRGSELPRWNPSSLDSPRYLMATVGTPVGVSLRPVLVGALHETAGPAWSGPIWSVSQGTDLEAGSFVFTTAGEIGGLVVRESSGLAIVPMDVLTAEATRILDAQHDGRADLRVEVRPLTPALARATGATTGVVVAWVDSRGPGARQLAVGDVIQSLNDQPMVHPRDWEVASGRLRAGEVWLHLRRRGKPLDVRFTVPVASASTAPGLGLSLRDVPGVGATVVHVEPRSAGGVARLQEGDLITLAGNVSQPTAGDIADAFGAARRGEAIMLAITRGSAHLVVGLVK